MSAASLQCIAFFIAFISALVGVAIFYRIRFLAVRKRPILAGLHRALRVCSVTTTVALVIVLAINFFSFEINEILRGIRLFFYLKK